MLMGLIDEYGYRDIFWGEVDADNFPDLDILIEYRRSDGKRRGIFCGQDIFGSRT